MAETVPIRATDLPAVGEVLFGVGSCGMTSNAALSLVNASALPLAVAILTGVSEGDWLPVAESNTPSRATQPI